MKEILVSFLALLCLNIIGMERTQKRNWQQLIEHHKSKLPDHVERVKDQVATGSWVKSARDSCPDLLKGWLSKGIELVSGHKQDNIDGISFLNRFFADEELRKKSIKAFITKEREERYQRQISKICKVLCAFEKAERKTLQTLIPLMHQSALKSFNQKDTLSQKELADLACETNEIDDNIYFEVVINNMVCTLLYAEVFATT